MNRWLLFVWKCGDFFYRRIRRFDFDDYYGSNILRLTVKLYRGPSLDLGEKGKIEKGDWVGELHLYNYRLVRLLNQLRNDTQMGLVALREMKRSLPKLVDFLEQDHRGKKVKAIVGITMLHRGAVPFGFSLADLPDGWHLRAKRFYMLKFMRLCHPKGWHSYKITKPKRVIMFRKELMRRYGQQMSISYEEC